MVQAVFDELGEPPGQYWNEAEVIRWVHLCLNRHAREGLSVEAEIKTSSIIDVQEYTLPRDFGEPKNIRYNEGGVDGLVPLEYVDKQDILTTFGDSYCFGTPYLCYIFQHKLGLYPIPNKPPLLECFSDECYTFTNVMKNDGNAYTALLEWVIEAESGSSGDTYIPAAPTPGGNNTSVENNNTPDPCRVYVSHVGVFLRRRGLQYPGNIQMVLSTQNEPGYEYCSKPIPASSFGPRPKWYYFDFSLSPIEITETEAEWCLIIRGDTEYIQADLADQKGVGVQIGVDDDEVLWYRLIEHTQDIQVDFYRNAIRKITDPDLELDLPYYPPVKCHDTIVDMVLDYALRKGQKDLIAAEDYRTRTKKDIKYTRAQAITMTRGDISRIPRNVRLSQYRGPYVVNRGSNRLEGRAW